MIIMLLKSILGDEAPGLGGTSVSNRSYALVDLANFLLHAALVVLKADLRLGFCVELFFFIFDASWSAFSTVGFKFCISSGF